MKRRSLPRPNWGACPLRGRKTWRRTARLSISRYTQDFIVPSGILWRELVFRTFEFVSHFVLRISDFASRRSSTSVENPLQIALIMQNKPNFRKSQINVNKVLTMNYEKKDTWWTGKKRTQTNPNKPNFRKAKNERKLICRKGL